eukprot:Rhum_TRINITY_DN12036_c1_g1::Rhum_TRINITY_DN12036_c1_g1_i1::g.48620::m.48620
MGSARTRGKGRGTAVQSRSATQGDCLCTRVVSVRRCVCSAEDQKKGGAGEWFLWRGSGRAAAPKKEVYLFKTLFETRAGGGKRDRRDGHRLDDGPCLDYVHYANISGSSGLGADNACTNVPFVFAHQRDDSSSAVCVLVKHVCRGRACLLQCCVHLIFLLRRGLQKRGEITLLLGFLARRLLCVVAALLLFQLLQLSVLVLATSAGNVQVIFEFVDDGLFLLNLFCLGGKLFLHLFAELAHHADADGVPLGEVRRALHLCLQLPTQLLGLLDLSLVLLAARCQLRGVLRVALAVFFDLFAQQGKLIISLLLFPQRRLKSPLQFVLLGLLFSQARLQAFVLLLCVEGGAPRQLHGLLVHLLRRKHLVAQRHGLRTRRLRVRRQHCRKRALLVVHDPVPLVRLLRLQQRPLL